MDSSFAAPPPPSDESDEPQSPPRSPSRLDFCVADLQDGDPALEAGGDSEMYDMSWACTLSHDNMLVEDATAVDVAPPDPTCHLIVEGGEDNPSHATDSYSHGNATALHTLSIPREHSMDQVVIEPQAPVPVRPFIVQFQLEAVDAEVYTPPTRISPQRLNYPHHGLSCSALLQQKTLWNSRHEEWAEWQSRMEQNEAREQGSETNDAYTGLATARPLVVESPPPYMRTPPSGLERDLIDHPLPRKHEQDVHYSIFPRVGDISALRDPYSMLYMFDMHQSSGPPVYNPERVQASISSSTLSSYTSSGSGDDGESDSTLVADDSPVPANQLHQESTSSLPGPSSWDRFCGWEMSWYARWQLLIGLFQRNHPKCDALRVTLEFPAPVQSKATPPSSPRPSLPFTSGEDHVDSVDDGDDDYGMVLPDPTFNVDFDEECERAMTLYGRESKCSEKVI